MSGGRPSKYLPEYARIASNLCKRGFSDAEIAAILDVSPATVLLWKAEHVTFSNAFKVGRAPANNRVLRALYQRAIAGDVDACKFWLKNRRPAEWKDRQEVVDPGKLEVVHRIVSKPQLPVVGGELEVIEAPEKAR